LFLQIHFSEKKSFRNICFKNYIILKKYNSIHIYYLLRQIFYCKLWYSKKTYLLHIFFFYTCFSSKNIFSTKKNILPIFLFKQMFFFLKFFVIQTIFFYNYFSLTNVFHLKMIFFYRYYFYTNHILLQISLFQNILLIQLFLFYKLYYSKKHNVIHICNPLLETFFFYKYPQIFFLYIIIL